MTRICNALKSLVANFNQQTKREDRVVGELQKLPNRSRLKLLKLSHIIMNDLMKVKLLFSLDEDLKVEPYEFPCCIIVGLLSLGWIDRNFRLNILFHQFPMKFL